MQASIKATKIGQAIVSLWVTRAIQRTLCLLIAVVLCNSALANETLLNAGKIASAKTQAYDAVGQELADIINTKDNEGMVRLLDFKAFAELSARSAFTNERDVQEFVRQLLAMGEVSIAEKLFVNIYTNNKHSKFIRTVNTNNPVVRVSYGEAGYEYLILTVKHSSEGRLRIVDMLTLTSGQNLSDILGAASQLAANPSETLIKRLFGEREQGTNLSATFNKAVAYRAEGNYKAAYDLFQALPENVRTKKLVLYASISLATLIGDDEYRAQLAQLDKYYGNEAASSFMLIDHHVFTGDYKKAHKSIDQVLALIGEDGAMLTIQASTCLLSGDYTCAEQSSRKSIALEPDLEDAYWVLVSSLLGNKKHKEVVDTLKAIQTIFSVEFNREAFDGEEAYKNFVQSPEFKQWMR